MNIKKNLPWIIPAAIVLILILWFIGNYNSLVNAEVNVDTSWAQVESQYQRRADLVPNLVATVKGFANQELTVFTEVTEARTRWLNAGTPSEQVQAANQLEGSLARLLVTVESYPELKSNENFLALQAELAGTENRVVTERKRYNDAVGAYNRKLRFFPTNIVAAMFGFEQRDFFEAEAGAEEAPDVEF